VNKDNPDHKTKQKSYSSLRFDLNLGDNKEASKTTPDYTPNESVESSVEEVLHDSSLTNSPTEVNFVLVNEAVPSSEPSKEDNYRPSILLAEDNPLNQRNIKTFLEKEGYQVDLANDGKEALKKLRDKSYHALLLDCEMPVLNGYEVIKSLRSRESKSRTEESQKSLPVIALAVHLSAEDRVHLKSIGMSACITKPVRRDNLLALLRELVSSPAT